MARPLRVELAGYWYHLTGRGTERRRIFTDDRDRIKGWSLLAEAVERYRLTVFSYVLMDNHYHGMVKTQKANFSEAMHWLQCSYSIWFNSRHKRVGPFFQGRYKALVVDPEEWGLGLSRYVHLNPVRLQRLGLGGPIE